MFTPDYRPIKLPKGATALDFAYYIHTEIGHRFGGAKVNSEIATIDYSLQNGDIVEIITDATRREPDEQWLHYVRTKKAKRSIRAWFRRPKRAVEAIQRGNILSLQCDIREAENAYIKAVDLDPTNTWAYNRLGHIMRLYGDSDRAMELYKTTLSLDPKNPFALAGIACIHYQNGDFQEAVKFYLKALDIKPNYVNALFGLSRCYCLYNQYQEADEVIAIALDIPVPRRRRATLHLIRMIARLGLGDARSAAYIHLSNALKEFNKVVPRRRLNDPPYYGLHVLYYYSIALACGSSEEYAIYLQRAINVCSLFGLANEVLVDLELFKPELIASLQEVVRERFPDGTIEDKIAKIKATLQSLVKHKASSQYAAVAQE